MHRTIYFYRVTDEFGEFSNFAPYPIMLDGKRWPTSEHYYQAQKYADPAVQEQIRQEKEPMLAARVGRDRRLGIRSDWDSIRAEVMRRALRAKFTYHPELAELLLSTGDALLVEHTEHDDFWGDGGDGSGRNMLGKLLMVLREELKESED